MVPRALLLSLLTFALACSSNRDDSFDGSGGGGDGGAPAICSERAALEENMRTSLMAAGQDPQVITDPDFALVLEAADGHQFRFEHGSATLTTVYESASTSKWVAAAVILDLVDQGILTLDDEPGDYLSFWRAPGVTLAQLLSFTSGFAEEALCLNLPGANFLDCVERIYEANPQPTSPGTTFDYASSHLQIAGAMAIEASGATG